MKTVIVIPTYNERENIMRLIPALFDLKISDLEVVVVDDNSPDETGDVALKFRETYPVYVIKRQRKLGIGTAYLDGFKKALAIGGEIIFEMDAEACSQTIQTGKIQHFCLFVCLFIQHMDIVRAI